MNIDRFKNPTVRQALWTSGAMAYIDQNQTRFERAMVRLELDPDLRHERREPHEGVVDDYRPLTRAQVKILLTAAIAAGDIGNVHIAMQTRDRVGFRLAQAVKGNTSPREMGGFVDDVRIILDWVYRDGLSRGVWIGHLVEMVMSVLANEQPNIGVISEAAARQHNTFAREVQFVRMGVFGAMYAVAITFTDPGYRAPFLSKCREMPIGFDGVIPDAA